MKKMDAVKAEYLAQTRKHLGKCQTELHMFEELWAAGRLREAYLLVDETTRDRGLIQNREFRQAEEELFWTLRWASRRSNHRAAD